MHAGDSGILKLCSAAKVNGMLMIPLATAITQRHLRYGVPYY